MILNGISGNIFNISQTCRDVCTITKNMTTVFSVYDMCKDSVQRYPELKKKVIKIEDPAEGVEGRGQGRETEMSVPYWSIAGAEQLGVVSAESVLAREILDRMQKDGKLRGVISFPQFGSNFKNGNLRHALGARSWKIQFHEDRLNLDEQTFFYSSNENEENLKLRETRSIELTENEKGEMIEYTGEWISGEEIRQGRGRMVNSNGDQYDGFFSDNAYNGKGKLTFSKNDKEERKQFTGTFKSGEFDGFGTMTLVNGESYQTKWQNGAMKDQGIYTFVDGTRVRFTVSPEQIMVFEDRVIFPESDFRVEYRGQLKDRHIMHGQGTLTLRDGSTLSGEWNDGNCHQHDHALKDLLEASQKANNSIEVEQ